MLGPEWRVHDNHIKAGAHGGDQVPRIRLHQLNVLHFELLKRNSKLLCKRQLFRIPIH
jgi:hypothetical protein